MRLLQDRLRVIPGRRRGWAIARRACGVTVLALGSVACLAVFSFLGSETGRAATARFRAGVVLVRFRAGTSSGQRRRDVGMVAGRLEGAVGGGVWLVRLRSGGVPWAVTVLRGLPGVLYAEPDYLLVESGTPSDPSFGLQWALQNKGQLVNGVSGSPAADVKATAAWDVTTGSRAVVVAEVDSGVDYTHPDLAANIWSNPGGVFGCAAGTHGYNVLGDACDPMDDETIYGGHGTHVAGHHRSGWQQRVGVTGVNWATTILPVKWLELIRIRLYERTLIEALNWVLNAKQAG